MTTETTLTNRELDAWLAEHLFPDRWIVVHVSWSEQVSPKLSSTGNGLLLVLEAMRERGYGASISVLSAGTWQVLIAKDDDIDWVTDDGARVAPSLPRAVAEAAKAALEAQWA